MKIQRRKQRTSQVIQVDNSAAILVQFLKGQSDPFLSGVIHGSSHSSQELVVINLTVFVDVDVVEKQSDIADRQIHSELIAHLTEFREINAL